MFVYLSYMLFLFVRRAGGPSEQLTQEEKDRG